MSTSTQNEAASIEKASESKITTEVKLKPEFQFRSPQDFSLAIEDALKGLQTKIEDVTSTLNGKLNDMESKLQLLEKAINEAIPALSESNHIPASIGTDTEEASGETAE